MSVVIQTSLLVATGASFHHGSCLCLLVGHPCAHLHRTELDEVAVQHSVLLRQGKIKFIRVMIMPNSTTYHLLAARKLPLSQEGAPHACGQPSNKWISPCSPRLPPPPPPRSPPTAAQRRCPRTRGCARGPERWTRPSSCPWPSSSLGAERKVNNFIKVTLSHGRMHDMVKQVLESSFAPADGESLTFSVETSTPLLFDTDSSIGGPVHVLRLMPLARLRSLSLMRPSSSACSSSWPSASAAGAGADVLTTAIWALRQG